MKYQDLVGKYLNGYKIVKVEDDPFIKGQVNLWTDEQEIGTFGDRGIIKFFVRDESNTAQIYQELIDKNIYSLKQALNEIKEYINGMEHLEGWISIDGYAKREKDILQMIDNVLGEEK